MSLDPDLTDLLRTVIESRLTDVHTSIPGRVVSYDAATQTADIEIVILRAETAESGATVHETYPVIPSVPVGWPSGGGYSLQFPLEAGDGVWLVFSESAIANWRETGDISPPGDLDRFDISYPIALPCARHSKQPLPTGTGALLTVPGGGAFDVSSGGAAVFVPRDDKLQAELTRIKADLTTLKAATQVVATAVDALAAGTGTAFTTATASVPSNPGSTASATLKAQ